MRVLVDADLVLERFLQRSKFLEKAKNLFKLISVSENIEAYITDIGLEKIAKISSKLATKNKINAESLIINQLQNKYKFKIFRVTENILNKARKFDEVDFESAMELSCAIAGNFDGIITEYSQKFGNYINVINMLSVGKLEKKWLQYIYEKEPTNQIDSESLSIFKRFYKNSAIRIKILEYITTNYNNIKVNSARALFIKQPELILPGGAAYHCRNMAACLRDMEIFLRYVSYAFLAGDKNVLEDRVLNGLKETYIALGVPCQSVIIGVEKLKKSTITLLEEKKEIKQDESFETLREEIVGCFDVIINSLS